MSDSSHKRRLSPKCASRFVREDELLSVITEQTGDMIFDDTAFERTVEKVVICDEAIRVMLKETVA